jgi:hypothetical protein
MLCISEYGFNMIFFNFSLRLLYSLSIVLFPFLLFEGNALQIKMWNEAYKITIE